MKLIQKIDKLWVIFTAIILALVFGATHSIGFGRTYAEGDEVISSERYFVNIYDAGQRLVINTGPATVEEVLSRAGVVFGSSDIVEPSLESQINGDNFFINIYRARPVLLKDGTQEKYVMTASYDVKTIAKMADMVIYDGDEVELARNTNFLEVGAVETYKITRNGGRIVTVEEEIPFGEETVRDFNMASGTSEVRQLGEIGMKRVSYEVLYVNNEEVSREVIAEEVVREPVARIVAIGAKKSIPPEWSVCGEWAREAGVSEAELSLALDLIYRESGCRVDAENYSSGAYGIPQALPGNKMATAGDDWKTNPVTQIRWMIGYVNGRYGGWAGALDWWYSHGWY